MLITRGKLKACFARFGRKFRHNNSMRAELILPAQCQRNVEGINITTKPFFFSIHFQILKLVKITFLSRGECFYYLGKNMQSIPQWWQVRATVSMLWPLVNVYHDFFFHSRLTYGDIYRNSFKLVVNGRNAVTLKIRQCLE